MFWESVLDDVLLEALFLALCSRNQSVDDVLLEALFLWLSHGSGNVRDVLLEALFLALCSWSQSLMMFCWRHCL